MLERVNPPQKRWGGGEVGRGSIRERGCWGNVRGTAMIGDSVSAHIPVYLFKRERLSVSEVEEGRRLQKNFLKF